MIDYQSQFELLSHRRTSLPSDALLGCFISGLKPHIKGEVQVLQPINLTQVIAFVKLQEDKYNDCKAFSNFLLLLLLNQTQINLYQTPLSK